MKIIGWDRKDNVVRFASGKDDLNYWSGEILHMNTTHIPLLYLVYDIM